MRPTLLVLVALVSACAGAPRDPVNTCEDPPISGSPESLTLTNTEIDGVVVDAPLTCGDDPDAYIRLQGDGWRTLVMGRGPIDGYAGCSPEAVLNGPKDGCPTVQFDLFGKLVAERAKARGVTAVGLGLGVCGDISGGYDEWNPSLIIYDWTFADPTIQEAARLMKELQIGNHVGVSVTHPMCGIALESD